MKREAEKADRSSNLFLKGMQLNRKDADRYTGLQRAEHLPGAADGWCLHQPGNTLVILISLCEYDTYSCTALAMESAVDPVSLTLSKVTFGRSSSSLSLLICLGDRPRGSICAGKRHIMD